VAKEKVAEERMDRRQIVRKRVIGVPQPMEQ
jgi:hypothetical protein